MKKKMNFSTFLLLFVFAAACSKKMDVLITTPDETPGTSQNGMVRGSVRNTAGNAIPDAKITIEHTVWYGTYLFATSSSIGNHRVTLPDDPAGDWTAKAQLSQSAYGHTYKFDLEPDNTGAFNRSTGAVRNFTWKLSGARPDQTGYYGAHVDLYQFGADVDMTKIQILFTPYPGEQTLIDGSPAASFQRSVEDVSGTYMIKDVPIGKYTIKIMYAGKKLLLNNRHEDDESAETKTVVFGKNGYLGETEYNCEFYVTE